MFSLRNPDMQWVVKMCFSCGGASVWNIALAEDVCLEGVRVVDNPRIKIFLLWLHFCTNQRWAIHFGSFVFVGRRSVKLRPCTSVWQGRLLSRFVLAVTGNSRCRGQESCLLFDDIISNRPAKGGFVFSPLWSVKPPQSHACTGGTPFWSCHGSL